MNALELAEECQDGYPLAPDAIAAAKMLRSQHEAIVKLREALAELKAHATQIDSKVGYLSTTRKQEVSQIYNLAAKALKDTEDLK